LETQILIFGGIVFHLKVTGRLIKIDATNEKLCPNKHMPERNTVFSKSLSR